MNDCNEGARKMERMEEICVLQTQIEFKTKVRKHAIDQKLKHILALLSPIDIKIASVCIEQHDTMF